MLTYDDRAHIYRLHGRRIPSVTQALKLAGHIDTRFYSAEAAARGRAVHAGCELVDGVEATQQLVNTANSVGGETVERYVEAYSEFLHDCRPTYAGIEVLCAHPDGEYGGRPDRLVEDLFGEAGVLELKTGGEEEWHGYQLALYQLMRPMGSRWVVYLQENGRYKLRRRFAASDYRIGRDAVAQAWQSAQFLQF